MGPFYVCMPYETKVRGVSGKPGKVLLEMVDGWEEGRVGVVGLGLQNFKYNCYSVMISVTVKQWLLRFGM